MPQASLLSFFTATAQSQAIRKKTANLERRDRTVSQKEDLQSLFEQQPPNPEEKNDCKVVESCLDKEPRPSATAARLEFTLPHNPSITIAPVTSTHLPALARLTTNLLPIKYPPSFYTEVTEDPASASATFSSVALFTSPSPTPAPNPAIPATEPATPIGWIRCSLHPLPVPTPDLQPQNELYIKALLLHPAYRALGIATSLLNQILSNTAALIRFQVVSISAHVWESNTEALEWYAKRGFERVEFVDGYYRRLRPGGAWLVRIPLESLRGGRGGGEDAVDDREEA